MSAEKSREFDKTHYKFVRAGESLALDDIHLQHRQIAELNKLTELIEKLRKSDPSEIDGGIAAILTPIILILGNSDSINAPVFGFEDEAREKTVELFSGKFSDYEIKKSNF